MSKKQEQDRQQAVHRKVALLHAGLAGADIARELHVHHSLVYRVIAGTKRSRRIEAHIAKALKTPRSELWPRI